MNERRPVYRVRAVWEERGWTAHSLDLDVEVPRSRQLEGVAQSAKYAIARVTGARHWGVDVIVHPVVGDEAARATTKRAVASRAAAKAAAREAASQTADAVDALSGCGMVTEDVERLLELPPKPERFGYRRHSVARDFVDPDWIDPFEEEDAYGWQPIDPWSDRWYSSDDPSFPRRLLGALAEEVGGEDVLAGLDDTLLPDEAFVWHGIADDICPRVEEALALVDHACEAVFDVECRTACRRLLSAVAVRNPDLFRRSSNMSNLAAGVCCAIGKANRLFGTKAPPRQRDVGTVLGVGSPGSRVDTIARVVAPPERWHGRTALGSPRFLVAAHRKRIIDLRDFYAAVAS